MVPLVPFSDTKGFSWFPNRFPLVPTGSLVAPQGIWRIRWRLAGHWEPEGSCWEPHWEPSKTLALQQGNQWNQQSLAIATHPFHPGVQLVP